MGKTEHGLLSSNHNLFPLYLTGLGDLDFKTHVQWTLIKAVKYLMEE